MPDEVEINSAALRVLEGRQGPIGQMLSRVGIAVESSAKTHATGNHMPGANFGLTSIEEMSGPNVITNRLRGSITWALEQDEEGLSVLIGTNVEYALPVEMGHDVKRGGQVVGHAPPYPYLRKALDAARTGL